MRPDKNELMDRLNRKIEAMIIVICIIIITACCLYAYIYRPIEENVKSSLDVGYEKFRSFSLFLGDTTGTEEYEERTVSEHTDDWGIRYVIKERIK
jgi:hypothetical protein